MITGDHKKTAMAIAKEVGLNEEKDLVIEGHELNNMDTDTLAEDHRKSLCICPCHS